MTCDKSLWQWRNSAGCSKGEFIPAFTQPMGCVNNTSSRELLLAENIHVHHLRPCSRCRALVKWLHRRLDNNDDNNIDTSGERT